MRKLAVLIDGRPLQFSWHRGIGRTFKMLAGALKYKADLTILTQNELFGDIAAWTTYNNIRWSMYDGDKIEGSYAYDVYHIIDPMSIYHGLDSPFLMPVDAAITTATFYDLIPLKGYLGGINSWPAPVMSQYYGRLNQLTSVNKVFTISNDTKIKYEIEVGKFNAKTIMLGTELPECGGITNPLVSKLFEKQHPYILSVGGCDPHKNLLFMKEVFLALKGKQPDLKWVVATHESQWLDQLNFSSIPGIIVLTDTTDYELQELYKNTKCLCFPSLAEGLGLPPFEAAQHGTPVVCSVLPSLPDSFCKIELKISKWVNIIDSILNNNIAMNTSLVQQTSWNECADNYVNAWQQLINARVPSK